MARLLVVGTGHLGQHLLASDLIAEATLWHGRMEELTVQNVREAGARVVLCVAGKTDLPWCEAHPSEAWSANVDAPLALARRLWKAGIPYIHASSGCVFNGPYTPNGRAFGPDDPVTPACWYAWTKAACDAMLLQDAATQNGAVAILRPRQVYSPAASLRNTLDKLRRYDALLETPNSMTSADTIAKTIRALVADVHHPLWGRVVNVYDSGIASPFMVGRILAGLGLRDEPKPLAKADLDAWHTPRRVDTVLLDAEFEALIKPPTVGEELRRVAALYKATMGRAQA